MSVQGITTVPVDFAIPLSCLGNLYRLVVLPSGVRALLISSPQLAQAAVAVCVGAGSFSDGKLPGLAHLCEHMVFAGLKQFPKAAEFHKLVSDHQGHVNAYTVGQHTTFHYDIDTKGYAKGTPVFEHTLAMFASFVAAPLVPTKMLAKEIAAIHGEHTRNTSDIDRILYHGMRLLADESHPFHQFGTGDKPTLSKPLTLILKDMVVQFYRDHYVAKNTTVVVKGPQLLNHLQRVVFSSFARIPTNEPPISSPSNSTTTTTFFPGQFLHIRSSVKEKLRLVFPVKTDSSQREFFLQCWCNLLGDESAGSLGNYLRHEKHFILAIYVHSMSIADGEKVLLMDIDLLAKGVYHLDEVIATTNAYIAQFLGQVTPALARYVSDVFFMLQLGFYFRNSTDIADEVSSLARTLHQPLPAENLIKGFTAVSDDIRLTPELAHELAEGIISDLREFLSPDNCCFIYLGDEIQRMSSYLGVEELAYDRYYHIDYSRCRLLSVPTCTIPATAGFHIPDPNPYIGDLDGFNLHNHTSTNDNTFGAASAAADIQAPFLVEALHHHEVWCQPCLWQHCTHLLVGLEASSVCLGGESLMDLATVLLAHWLGELLLPKLYAAEMIGYQWGIYSNWNETPLIGFHVLGLTLGILGVVDTIVTELNQIFQSLDNFQLTNKIFRGIKSKYLHSLELMKTKLGVEQALMGRLLYTEIEVPDHATRIHRLKQLGLAEFKQCLTQFSQHLGYLRMLVLTEEGEAFTSQLTQTVLLSTASLSWSDRCWPQSYQVLNPSTYQISQPSMNPEDLMNTVLYYIHLGPRHDQQSRLWAELINFYIDQHAVTELRSKRQLGYHVMLVFVMARTTVGVMIVVSSPKSEDTQRVVDGINDFLLGLERNLAAMLEAQFAEEIVDLFSGSTPRNSSLFFRKPSVGQVDHTASSVAVAHWNNWEQIYNHDYQFHGWNQLVVENATRDRFLSAFQEKITPISRKAFIVNVSPGVSDATRKSVMVNRIKDMIQARGIRLSAAELEEMIDSNDTMELAMEKVMLRTLGTAKGLLYKTAKLLKRSPSLQSKRSKSGGGNRATIAVDANTLPRILETDFTIVDIDKYRLNRDLGRL